MSGPTTARRAWRERSPLVARLRHVLSTPPVIAVIALCAGAPAPGVEAGGAAAGPAQEIEAVETPMTIPSHDADRTADGRALAAFLRAHDGALVRLSLDIVEARLATDPDDTRVRRLRLGPDAALEEVVFIDAASPPALFPAGGAVLARGYFRVLIMPGGRRATVTAVPENDVLSDPALDHRWRPL